MKVAVTGVSGFLGGAVARHLAEMPEVDSLLGLDVLPPDFQHGKFSFRTADVRTADFEKLLAGCDAVYHLAFIVQPPKKMPMSVIDEINVEGSRRVFEGAAAAGVPKIVYSSSVAAYGAHPDNPAPLTEESPLRPNEDWYYSRTKGRVEAYLDGLQSRRPDLIVIRFRPCIFLGPGITNSIGKGIAGRVLLTFDKTLRLDLCWLDDVADAFALALRCAESDAFNLAGDGPLSMADIGRITGKPVLSIHRRIILFFARVGRALGLLEQGEVEWVESADRGEVLASARKAKEKLGWKPRFDAAGALIEFCKLDPQLTAKRLRRAPPIAPIAREGGSE